MTPQSMNSYHLLLCILLLFGGLDSYAQYTEIETEHTPNDGAPIIIGKSHQLYSQHLNETRTISLYVPPDYNESDERYPVVYVLDGESYFLQAASSVKALAGLGWMPKVLVVAIHNTQRERDMTPPNISIPSVSVPGADVFLDFIEEELVSFIDTSFRTLPLRVLVGHSHGGLLSNYAFYARPHLFQWHLALDSPVHLGDFEMTRQIISFLENTPEHIGRLVTLSSSYKWPSDQWQKVSEKVSDKFFAKAIELPEETHQSMIYTGIYKGLRRLFQDYSFDTRTLMPFASLESIYDSRSIQYGYPIPIPERIFLDYAEENLMVGQPQRAKPFIDEAVAIYGESRQTDRLAEWLESLMQNPVSETTEDLLLSERPNPEAMAPFLGTWEGLQRGHIPVEVIFEQDGENIVGRTVGFALNRCSLPNTFFKSS